MQQKGFKKAYCIGMDGLRKELENAGIEVLGCEIDKNKEFDQDNMLDGFDKGVDSVVRYF